MKINSIAVFIAGILCLGSLTLAQGVNEFLDFTNNQLPASWTLSIPSGPGTNASIANNRFEARSGDTYAEISRLASLATETTQLNVSYTGNIADVFWGMGNQIHLYEPGGHTSTFIGKAGYGNQTMRLGVGYENGSSYSFALDQSLAPNYGTYSVNAIFRDQQVTYEVTKAGSVTPLYHGTVSVPQLQLSDINRIGLFAFTTTGEASWVDDVRVRTFSGTLANQNAQTITTPFQRSEVLGFPIGNSSYDIAFTDNVLKLSLDIRLTGAAPGTDLLRAWETTAESIWNGKFELQDGISSFPIMLDVAFVDSGGDVVVEVHNGDGEVDMLNWVTGSPSGWGAANQGRVAAHEIGHMLGLYDEYATGRLDPNNPIVDDNSIMGSRLGMPEQRHYETFLNWIEGRTQRDMILAEAPGYVPGLSGPAPDEGLPVVVPEPSCVVLLLLGAALSARRRTLRTHERNAWLQLCSAT